MSSYIDKYIPHIGGTFNPFKKQMGKKLFKKMSDFRDFLLSSNLCIL